MFVTIAIIAIIAYVTYAYVLAKPKEKVEGLQDKYVLITGCDSGFGRLLTEYLSKQNVHVFAACLTQDAVQELKQAYPSVNAFTLDVTKAEQVQQAYQFVVQTLPKGVGLWGLVNNAGILVNGFIDWLSMEDYSRVIDVNLNGTIRMTNQFLPLVKQAKGRIVNIASILGMICPSYFAPYSASKAAIIAFSNILRREMKAFNVSVSCLCPGLFRTALSDAEKIPAKLKQQQAKLSQDLQKVYDQAFFTKFEKALTDVAKKGSTEVHKVAEAIDDALFSTAPQEFYYVGFDAWIFLIISSLPSSVSDWLLRKLSSLPFPVSS